MAWIKVVPAESSEGELREAYRAMYQLYPPEYGTEVPAVRRPNGVADSISSALSLIPQALFHGMSTLGVLLDSKLPLSRRQHEMIATVVSALNGCFY